jgi:hypothetical protein
MLEGHTREESQGVLNLGHRDPPATAIDLANGLFHLGSGPPLPLYARVAG